MVKPVSRFYLSVYIRIFHPLFYSHLFLADTVPRSGLGKDTLSPTDQPNPVTGPPRAVDRPPANPATTRRSDGRLTGTDGSIRAGRLQQNLQQTCASALRLGFGCASASILSPYLTSIKRLSTSTYKRRLRTVDPKVEGSRPFGLVTQVPETPALTSPRHTQAEDRQSRRTPGASADRRRRQQPSRNSPEARNGPQTCPIGLSFTCSYFMVIALTIDQPVRTPFCGTRPVFDRVAPSAASIGRRPPTRQRQRSQERTQKK